MHEPVREAQYWEEDIEDDVTRKRLPTEGLPGIEDDYDDEVFLK